MWDCCWIEYYHNRQHQHNWILLWNGNRSIRCMELICCMRCSYSICFSKVDKWTPNKKYASINVFRKTTFNEQWWYFPRRRFLGSSSRVLSRHCPHIFLYPDVGFWRNVSKANGLSELFVKVFKFFYCDFNPLSFI